MIKVIFFGAGCPPASSWLKLCWMTPPPGLRAEIQWPEQARHIREVARAEERKRAEETNDIAEAKWVEEQQHVD
jgi:hypothetical protein